MKKRPLLFASTNSGKLVEVRRIAEQHGLPIIGLAEVDLSRGKAPQVEESADTYQANAELKARAYARWSGMHTIADDTGLEVRVLGGKPGVRSARYAGEGATAADNRDLLLREMRGVSERRAQFVCELVMVGADSKILSAGGVLHGAIADQVAGSGGFGYDSIFYLPEFDMTLAEVKSRGVEIETHRIIALKKLFNLLSDRLN